MFFCNVSNMCYYSRTLPIIDQIEKFIIKLMLRSIISDLTIVSNVKSIETMISIPTIMTLPLIVQKRKHGDGNIMVPRSQKKNEGNYSLNLLVLRTVF